MFPRREHMLVAAGLWWFLTGCAAPDVGQDARLASRLDAVLGQLSSTGAVVRARVVELPGGRELYARDADQACTPASNFKLLTTAVGLDLFGANHRVKTYLALDGDDLWLIGTGDPATGDARLAAAGGGTPVTLLEAWASVLQRRGVRQIRGDLVYDDSAFERQPRVHPTWRKDWLLHWYAAPTSGLNFGDNSVDITVFPTEEGKPVRYEVMPPVQDIRIINECMTGAKGEPEIVKSPGGNVYRLGGICTKKTELKSKPVEEPGAFFADALRHQLQIKGITVRGEIRRAEAPLGGAPVPPAEKVIAVHETPLPDILSRINKNSQNLFAECLCKLSGQTFQRQLGRSVPGSWEDGGHALRAFLARNGIDHQALAPRDGSGLSPQNRVTARMLTDLLKVMHSRPDAEVYRSSLTAAGIDGSLKDRMADLKGHVFGKTGYIGGVSSLSGYVKTRRGTWLAFSIIFNRIPSQAGDDDDVAPFTKLQDEACRVLVGWPG
ncbi:MAG TPA: D-alanyl-D-alanine carboxypeptidase/D-alanyl-D-alanine-endopeptidase [Phycisphaerae bacterium]|nr:D-alanyl-D-alanine carboxypeptidase/D-alanyl-D-alanine-endopeptidase [Phycisphaerae bacterium]HRY70554.1 D-alanyl-D-alanine carboxypeptidase/D-alanyl-D-alanine-endopeptidase [Phycisphaerae bacterium]HSA28002.1 D-alanyl-D-alanine carboxypeptidase/D-alanyl-D-alanine-endopeptidase [Phycisphaerae bacterium]